MGRDPCPDGLHSRLPPTALPPDGRVCPETRDLPPQPQGSRLTTLFRWIASEILAEEVIIAVDGTGIKVANRGEWMREMWQVRRGWLKVHALIDVETNQILGLEVTDESVQDDQMFVPLLEQAQQHCGEEHPVHQVLGDGD